MILSSVNQKLAILLAANVAAAQLAFVVSYADYTAGSFTPGSVTGVTNNVASVDLLAAPAASYYRQVKWVSVNNVDTADSTVTVNFMDGAGVRRITRVTLKPGEGLEWTADEGWHKSFSQQLIPTADQVASTPVGGITASNVQAALAELDTKKYAKPTGTTAQYLRGDGTLATFPAIPAGTVTSVSASSSASGFGLAVANPTTTPALTLSVSDATAARTTLGAVGLTGNDTISGNKTFNNTVTFTSNPSINRVGQGTTLAVTMDVDAGQGSQFNLRTGNSNRWAFGKNAVAEGGSNAGSDFFINRYDDAGTLLGTALSINRSTGAVTLQTALSLSSGGTGGTDPASARAGIGAVGLTGNETVTGVKTFSSLITAPGLVLDRVGQAADANIDFRVDAGRLIQNVLRTGTSIRWTWGMASGAQTGGNVGADLFFNRYDDAGAYLGQPFNITRSTGVVNAPLLTTGNLSIGSGVAVAVAGAANPAYSQYGASASATVQALGAWANTGLAPQYCLVKSRSGVVGTFSPVISGDNLGVLRFCGDDGTAIQSSASLECLTTEAWSSSAWGARLRFVQRASGTTNAVETFGSQAGVGLTFGGTANVFLDANRTVLHRSYTIATLPSPINSGVISCSDLGGGAALLESDGTSWRRIRDTGYFGISTEAGATFTYTYLSGAPTVRLLPALTANATVTLTAGAPSGVRARFIRRVASTGAFNWSIGGLKNLTPGTWCEVESDGSNWYLTEYGTL